MSINAAETADLVNLTSDLIRIRTANPPGEEAAAARWWAKRLDAMASRVAIDLIARDRANVLATFDFGPGPALVFCSHLDVVPVQHERQWDPMVVDGRLFGRGACDAKGALAAMAMAAARLVANPTGLRGQLKLLAVADEELGAAGVQAAVRLGIGGDAAVIGEPTDNKLVLSSRGAVRMAITFHGRSAHSSTPTRGLNALYPAARFVSALELLHDDLATQEPPGTCAATVIAGGTKVNMIPDECTVHVDRRLSPVESTGEAAQEIQNLLKTVGANEAMPPTVTRAGTWLEPFSIPRNHWLATKLPSALGMGVGGPFPAGTDAPFLIAAGLPTAILGPGSIDVAHGEEESVGIGELSEATDLYEKIARFVLRAGFPD